jgi:hypothetical protein
MGKDLTARMPPPIDQRTPLFDFAGDSGKSIVSQVVLLTDTGTAPRGHSGRTTQVWEAMVIEEVSGKTIALFRCTQLILYPR